MLFVWINGLRGPEAQIWNEDQVNGEGKSKPVLFKIKLTEAEQTLSLNYLAMKYGKDKPNGQMDLGHNGSNDKDQKQS